MTKNKLILSFILLLIFKKSNLTSFKDMIYLICSVMSTFTIIKYFRSQQAKLYFKNNQQNQDIINQCPSIKKRKFNPTIYLPSGLLHTLVGSILPKKRDVEFVIEALKCCTQDDDLSGIKLVWPSFASQKNDLPPHYQAKQEVLIIIIPGLTGCFEDPYINNLSSFILNKGYTPVIYQYRLLNDQDNVSFKQGKTFDLTVDFRNVLNYLKSNYPQFKKYYAIGHSYGANTLVNYLGKFSEDKIIEGGVSVANPYCLNTCFKSLAGDTYDYIISFLLKSLIKRNQKAWKNAHVLNIDVQKCLNAQNLNQLLEEFTRRLQGYRHVSDYQRKFSCIKQIHKIKVPLLGISSQDDGVAVKSAIPIDEFQDNPNTILYLTKVGGHVGWIQGIFNLDFWYYKPSMEFLECLINQSYNEIN